jgi:hypothetical protein
MISSGEILSILAVVIAIVPLWLDLRRMQSDIPSKRLDNLSKSLDLLQEENEFLLERETHVLDYVQYLWNWIDAVILRHNLKDEIPPKKLEYFFTRRKPK